MADPATIQEIRQIVATESKFVPLMHSEEWYDAMAYCQTLLSRIDELEKEKPETISLNGVPIVDPETGLRLDGKAAKCK